MAKSEGEARRTQRTGFVSRLNEHLTTLTTSMIHRLSLTKTVLLRPHLFTNSVGKDP